MTYNADARFDQQDSHQISEDLNPLPRSVVRRTPFVLLDGEWRFALDLEDQGFGAEWFLGHDYTRTANFPGSIESHLTKIHDYKEINPSSTETLVAWYEREFIVPAEWHTNPNTLTQLTFGACGYETRVWLNGHLLRTVEGEAVHFGEYNSFSYELPPELIQPVNRLTIRVADSDDAEIPRGKQASRVYKQGGIWYQTVSGAVRSVWLEPVNRNRLRSRVRVSSNLQTGLVEFDLLTRIHDAGEYTLRLTVAPYSDKKTSPAEKPNATVTEFRLQLAEGERPQRFPIELTDIKAWSPSNPN